MKNRSAIVRSLVPARIPYDPAARRARATKAWAEMLAKREAADYERVVGLVPAKHREAARAWVDSCSAEARHLAWDVMGLGESYGNARGKHLAAELVKCMLASKKTLAEVSPFDRLGL